MKILIDMNLTPRWVPFLEIEGFTAVHWSSIGKANEKDSAIMSHAALEGFVVLTHDRDFGMMLAASRGVRPSIIQLRADLLAPEIVGHAVIHALSQMSEELSSGAIVSIDAKKTRLRVLPFPERP